jgi:hypothetical protein
MISFFRKIRQKLLEGLLAGQAGNKIGNYLKYAIGEIYILIMSKSPFWDLIWVEQTISQDTTVPLGTGYVGNPTLCKNHVAYLRHAISDYTSVFYRYFVPMGHSELQGSHKALNLPFL